MVFMALISCRDGRIPERQRGIRKEIGMSKKKRSALSVPSGVVHAMWAKVSKGLGLRGREVVERLNADPDFLQSACEAVLALMSPSLEERLNTEDRIWFSSTFKTYVLKPVLQEAERGTVEPARSGPSFVIPQGGMSIDETRTKLREIGDNDVFEPFPWLLYFLREVEKEARGEPSDLEKGEIALWLIENGIRVFPVLAYWNSDDGEWGVRSDRLDDDGRWGAGHRAFSARQQGGQATADA